MQKIINACDKTQLESESDINVAPEFPKSATFDNINGDESDDKTNENSIIFDDESKIDENGMTIDSAENNAIDSIAGISRVDPDDEIELSEIPRESSRSGLKSNKETCLLYTSPSPRDKRQSRMPSSA